jgi:hypothetical protein
MNKNSFRTSNGLIVSSAAIKTFKTLSQEAILHIFLISESNHIYFCFCYCYLFIFFSYWLGDRQKSKTLSQEAILHIFLISESNHFNFLFLLLLYFHFFFPIGWGIGKNQKGLQVEEPKYAEGNGGVKPEEARLRLRGRRRLGGIGTLAAKYL